jgi:hypothetical protein
MDPFDHMIRSTLLAALWYGTALFFWWAFGFEAVVVVLLAAVVYKSI